MTNRPFTKWVEQNISGWKLDQHMANPHAWNGDPDTSTFSEFFVYVPADADGGKAPKRSPRKSAPKSP